ncbi:MAG: NAD(P)-binding domain-containing protein [Bryobacteraceae bacterium]
MTGRIRQIAQSILDSPNTACRRPLVDSNFESNIKGLYIIGDLIGAPVVKLAMEQGDAVARHIAAQPDARGDAPSIYDLIVIGAGGAGLNAALVAQEHGLRVLVIEKNRIANTIEDFPEGKWVYAEPDALPAKGKLWLDGARKEDLVARWREIIVDNRLDVRVQEGVEGIARSDGLLSVTTSKDHYRARRVILATGQRGNPRRLGVPGEESGRVYHRLYSPKDYRGEEILVVGGGNSAVEAALVLAEENHVTLSYRGSRIERAFPANRRKLEAAIAGGRIRFLPESEVTEFRENSYVVQTRHKGRRESLELPYRHAFVLIGADLPTAFLRSLGVRLENDWTGSPATAAALAAATLAGLWLAGGHTGFAALNAFAFPGALAAAAAFASLVVSGLRGSRFAWLTASFLIAYTIYGVKQGNGAEFWPYRGWGYHALSILNRPWAFWYTVLYTMVMTLFGLEAMKRWGFDRKDRFQVWRYTSLLGFQWTFFFLIPEFLFRWAVEYQWVGALANDPSFANETWRSYGIVYAWPLFFHTFIGDPHRIWVVWGVFLSFVVIPVLAVFQGKRYCSWVCGCGGLAETLGDRWRHLAPKGHASIRWERMNAVVLAAAVLVTATALSRDLIAWLRQPGAAGLEWYHYLVDVWLIGIVPVTLYPFFGGKVWCRYWCPLAKMMELISAAFTRRGIGRFAIHANEKCIACGECTRYCQVGIDVMSFALKQEELNNVNSSCIGCGICVTVCPMKVLSFAPAGKGKAALVQIAAAPESRSTTVADQ